MIISQPARVLHESDLPKILHSALSILENTGILIENDRILSRFAEHGSIVDKTAGKLKIPKRLIEDMLSSAEKISYCNIRVELRVFAGVYQGYYLDLDGKFLPWTHEKILAYAKLAQNLPHVQNMFMLGYPVPGIPDKLRPLYEKLYCWRHGIDGGKAIWETGLCGAINEMWQIYAADKQTTAE